MIVQDFYIPKYDWRVRVYYAVTTYWISEILCELHRIGCRGEDFKQAYRNLSSGALNTGLTYSDFEERETVMVIALTSSPGEFQNSWDHEKGHLYDHDSINELLSWAKETLNNKRYPVGEFQLDKCAKILDCEKYLDSMILVISKNWENPTFYPTIDQLRLFREKIERGT